MSGCKKSTGKNQPSITYRHNKVKGTTFSLADFVHDRNAYTANIKQSSAKSDLKSIEILNTTQLISAVGKIWDCINPCAVNEPKGKLNHNSSFHKNVIFDNLVGEEIGRAPTLADENDNNKHFHADIRTSSNIATMVLPKFEILTVAQKLSAFETCHKSYFRRLFLPFSRRRTDLSNEYWKEKGLGSLGIQYDLENIYGWMKGITSEVSHLHNSITEVANKRNSKNRILGITVNDTEADFSTNTTHPANGLACRSDNCCIDADKSIDACDNSKMTTNTGLSNSLCADYFLGAHLDNDMNDSVSCTPSSSLRSECCINYLAPCKSTNVEFQCNSNDNEMSEKTRRRPQEYVIKEKQEIKVHSSVRERSQYALAKQEHAFAGAFAGIIVSLCLHPIDTIKTIIQSCHAEQKSLYHIGRSIVSERGLTGLYRGISSNIASSAPISAIYTFTYESVKRSLLPLFDKEYQSFAHCIAGGCASVATSFIFTPSERIKQQMQIGSHYNNCWNALVAIISKGGLPSLYAGWGAVLCRNIPHSVIKFYTYESLKQLMLSSQNSSPQPNTLQTLVCGGIAGSTAALFTTPFDVVKTRLQTQIPGSQSKYDSAFQALLDIGKNEGLKGLYRGLIPRLVMYVSQGALFFASYEFFKRLFCLEMPQINAQRIQYNENIEDDSTPLQLS